MMTYCMRRPRPEPRAMRTAFSRVRDLRPDQEQVRDVAARDEEHAEHRPQQDEEGTARVTYEAVPKGPDHRLPTEYSREPLRAVADLVETGDEAFGVRHGLLDGDPRPETRDPHQVVAAEVLARRIELMGDPDIRLGRGEVEIPWHHAHDLEARAVEVDVPPDDLGVGPVSVPPQALADEGHPGPLGTSSSGAGKRPRRGGTPMSWKTLNVIAATSTCDGGPSPTRGHWMFPPAYAPNFSKDRLSLKKNQYPLSENGASPLPPACGRVAAATLTSRSASG